MLTLPVPLSSALVNKAPSKSLPFASVLLIVIPPPESTIKPVKLLLLNTFVVPLVIVTEPFPSHKPETLL